MELTPEVKEWNDKFDEVAEIVHGKVCKSIALAEHGIELLFEGGRGIRFLRNKNSEEYPKWFHYVEIISMPHGFIVLKETVHEQE